MVARLDFQTCLTYCRFDFLPEGLEEKYEACVPNQDAALIPRSFLTDLFARYEVPETVRQTLLRGIEAIEGDGTLFHFTKFLVDVLCSARWRCDEAFYTNMTPGCMTHSRELYSFLLLLACVVPSKNFLADRGVPEAHYEEIATQFLKPQLDKLAERGDAAVDDFQWKMNFYTCSIFLHDRFYFIVHRFQDEFTMFRHVRTGKVAALRHAGETFRGDGQKDGVNGISDAAGRFVTEWSETDETVRANRINPMGFVEREPVVLAKSEWEPVLRKGDMLLALHIPSGPGYTPERLKASMRMALDFYARYFPELPIRGFWSESWLYDPALSLLLDPEKSNIVQVQRQMYVYPVSEGDRMLRHELFGDRNADPLTAPARTSLQKAAAEYMRKGGRFHTSGMIVLKEEVDRIGSRPYVEAEEIEKFREAALGRLAGR